MPLKRTWRCPFCTGICMTSPRHWNVQRHIRLMHGLTGEPVDHLTGLIRFQLQHTAWMNYRNGNFQRSASPIYQPREKRLNDWQPSYPYNINDDQDKKNWEAIYRNMKDLKIMETLKEIRENSARIVQQNIQILSHLAQNIQILSHLAQNIQILSHLARINNAGRF
jgi:hypothetical protein